MGEMHVNMNITLDGVIQANGGTTEQDAGYEYGGWERPYGDEESRARLVAELAWGDSAAVQLTDAATDVRRIRDEHAQVHTWGSADLLRTLFREGLVDQVNLWVSPVVIGTGKRLFPEGSTPTRFETAEPATTFPAGVLLLRYRRLDGAPETDSSPQTR